MAYQILYDGEQVYWKEDRMQWTRVFCYTVLCCMILCVFSYCCWPDGWQLIAEILYPGDMEVTRGALNRLGDSLQGGEDLSDVVFTFCREIINGS